MAVRHTAEYEKSRGEQFVDACIERLVPDRWHTPLPARMGKLKLERLNAFEYRVSLDESQEFPKELH